MCEFRCLTESIILRMHIQEILNAGNILLPREREKERSTTTAHEGHVYNLNLRLPALSINVAANATIRSSY